MLHMELIQDRREVEQRKMQDLERELETIQAQQRQIQAEQSSQGQQAGEIEVQLQQTSLSKPERDELEAQRAELLNTPPSRFGAAQNALAQREARVRERLALEDDRMQALERQLRQLSAAVR